MTLFRLIVFLLLVTFLWKLAFYIYGIQESAGNLLLIGVLFLCVTLTLLIACGRFILKWLS